MTYKQLINNIDKRVKANPKANIDLTAKQVDAVLDAFKEEVQEEMQQENGRVVIPDLFILKRHVRAARTGRNPKTGEPIQIAEKTGIKLVVAKETKELLND